MVLKPSSDRPRHRNKYNYMYFPMVLSDLGKLVVVLVKRFAVNCTALSTCYVFLLNFDFDKYIYWKCLIITLTITFKFTYFYRKLYLCASKSFIPAINFYFKLLKLVLLCHPFSVSCAVCFVRFFLLGFSLLSL